MRPSPRSLLDYRLVIVTGKGGVGKTTIACAVAEAARQAGKRVLLAETSAIESVAGRFEAHPRPLGYAGRSLRQGLHALRVDPHDALADYVRVQTRMGPITDRILKTETFSQLLEAAPGWRELIILGKIWHLEQAQEGPSRNPTPVYDLIVVDAPATGHGLTFLDVPRVVQQAVRSGPLARHAGWVEELIHDRARTLLLPVTLAEELPVSETCELVERARREIDIGLDRIVVNRMRTDSLAGPNAALAALPDDLDFESLPPVPVLRELLKTANHRASLGQAERERVGLLCELPIVNFPKFPHQMSEGLGWEKYADRVLSEPEWIAPEAKSGDST